MENLTDKSNEQLLEEINLLKTEIANFKKNKDYFQIIAENAVDFIAITSFDLKAKYLYVSPSILNASGYKPEEMLGKSSLDFIHPEDKSFLLTLIKKYINQKLKSVLKIGDPKITETIEFRFKNKAGDWSYLQNNFSFIGKNVLTISRDITEQKQMNLAIKRSEKRLSSFMNSASDGFMLWDANLNLEEINNVSLNAFPKGSRKEDIIGKNIIELIPDIKESGRFESYKKVLETGESITQDEIIAHSKFDEIVLAVKLFKVGTGVGVIGSDITERKKSEEALKLSANLLNTTQQLTKVGGWKWNVENQTMFWTDETYRIHEIDPEKIKSGSNKHIELGAKCYDKEDIHVILEAFQKCVDKGIAYDMELPFTTVKGNRIWIRTTAQAEKENGKVVGVNGNIMDITKHKLLEKELQQSEEKYRVFFENNDAIILFVNPDNGEIIFSNEAAAKFYGYSRERLTGLNIANIHTLTPQEIKVKMADARTRGQNYFLFKHKLASGEIRDVEVYQSKLLLNDKDVFSIIVHDITDRLQTKAALQESENLLDATQKIAKVGGWKWVKETNNMFWTNETYRIHEIDSTGMESGSTEHINRGLKCYDEKDRQIIHEAFQKCGDEGISYDLEFPFTTEKGNRIWIRTAAQPIKGNNKVISIIGNIIDITESKLAEERLKESEQNFKAFTNQSNDGISVADLDGNYTFVNPSFCKIVGWTAEELLQMNVFDVTADKQDTETFKKTKTVKEGEPVTVNLLRKDGTEFIAEVIGKVFSIKGKKSVLGTIRDITERKQSEEKIKRYSRLFEDSLNEIFLFDAGTLKFVQVNSGALRNLGYNSEEIKNLTPLDIKPEIDLETFENIISPLRKGEKEEIVFETVHQRKNKSLYNVEIHLQLIHYEKTDLFAAIILDITERKHSEEVILKNKYYLTKAQEIGVIGTWELDIQKNILTWTEENYKIFGVPIGTEMNLELFMECIHPEDLDYFSKKWNAALNKEPYDIDHRILVNNKVKWVREKAEIKFDSEGKAISAIGFTQDITKRKSIETKLNTALEKAEESDRLKTAFLANMSHEIRTPMNGILGFADLLKQPELPSDVRQKYIGIIEKSGVRMLNIINDLIDISKVEAGQMELVISESNINEQIEYIYTFFKPEVERKGMQLFFNNTLTAKESVIKTDREKMFAILTNLVKNAIKYSDKGSIELGYEKKDNYLEFYVKDTGIGIPKEMQQAIFNRFIQADSTDTRAFKGAGLGLAISKAYVEMLGGRIWVESEPGVGSQFYFTIPHTSDITEMKSGIQISDDNVIPEIQIKKLKILIAEDEELADLLLSLILEKLGKEILHAKNGIEAVEICRNNPDIDLVLMDIMMPEMYGYEAARKIREFNTILRYKIKLQ